MNNNIISVKLFNLEKRIEKLEKIILNTNDIPKQINQIERILIKNITKISINHLIIISLYMHKQQTKNDIQMTLKDWGKDFKTWFRGGNFNNRLVKTNIIKLSEKKQNEQLYELTKSGQLKAEKLLDKIKSI